MASYALRRLLQAVPTLLAIITLAFFLMRAAPGGPFDGERALPPAIEANLKRAYHLDQPLPAQFAHYLGGVARGDFGPSFTYKDFSVADLLAAGFPISLRLGLAAAMLAVLLGGGLGVVAALRRDGWIDHAVMGLALVGVTLPNFVVAPLLTLLFGLTLHWLPVAGWGDGTLADDLAHMVLPVAALALPQVAVVARLTRSGLVEALRANFVRTARAKGLGGPAILFRHVLRPALLPVVSYLGPAVAGLVTGSVVVEQIFALPGIGRYFVQGAINRDYTLVMGTVILYGTLIVLMNLAVDLAYGLLDPRVRYE
ncbi:MAG: oligopeptide ABC transporter permease OppB [Azospirillaceae bacterium]|nr:oligopeptide ABC transporter permease OppB [Azospirillaceae bacterium]